MQKSTAYFMITHMTRHGLSILFTGDYLPDYNRTKIIRIGLEKLGHHVIQLPFKKMSSAVKKQILELAPTCDFIFMPSFTHREVASVRHLVGKKIIIFDPLISRYLTKVFDYKLVSRFGISALRNYYRDKWSMDAADFVVTDTLAHKKYFHKTFKIPNEKMGPLYIGNDFAEFYPMPAAGDSTLPQNPLTAKGRSPSEAHPCRVGFYGGFIPLQGVMNILGAAELLRERKDLIFELIGTGFEFEKAKRWVADKNLKNVILPGWVQADELPARVNQFDIALGIFGSTQKSDLVIPNKIYHYAACARPIITKDSTAIRELFSANKDLVFTDTQPEKIAQAIIKLAENPEQRQALGQSAFNKLKTTWGAPQVAEQLLHYFFSIKVL